MRCIRETNDGVILTMRIKPNARRSGPRGFYGENDEAIVWAVAAPPVDGKANDELVRSVAETFGIPPSRLTIVHGSSSRTKAILLGGARLDAVASVLAQLRPE